MSKGDGRYPKLMTSLAKTALLILDDWGLAALSDEHRRDLLERLEDRHDRRATLVTSQLPVEHWHEALGEPTLADAILDRLVHKAYTIPLQGESMRTRQGKEAPQAMGRCDEDSRPIDTRRAEKTYGIHPRGSSVMGRGGGRHRADAEPGGP
jgi:IstB-like ATP binding protein